MHYKDLLKAAELFMKDPYGYDYAYRCARETIDWRNLHNLSKEEIINRVIEFLNDWGCRLESTYFDKIASGLKDTFGQIISFLKAIENETLEDIDFSKVKKVDDKDFNHFQIIHLIFVRFCNIGYRFRWVAASKTLHMVLPRVFVMWDNPICKALGLDLSTHSYAYNFLPQMKQEANEAISTYMQYHNCERDVAIRSIIEKSREISGYEKTLAKLVDEYNWIKYTRKRL